MDTATIAQGLRVTAALIDLASHTLVLGIEQFADRLHPPTLEGYAGFDTDVRLCDLPPLEKARAMLDDADGYYTQVWAEREEEVRAGRARADAGLGGEQA